MNYKKFKLPLALFAVTYATGVVLFHFIEGWGWVDSFYFVGTSINALGYGDFYPLTDLGKIITTIYSFIGIGLFLYIMALLGSARTRKNGS